MKMTQEVFTALKEEITAILDNNPTLVNDYETGNFPRSEKTKVLQTRFNWDLFLNAQRNLEQVCIEFRDLNDSHIETALKRICPILTKRF